MFDFSIFLTVFHNLEVHCFFVLFLAADILYMFDKIIPLSTNIVTLTNDFFVYEN